MVVGLHVPTNFQMYRQNSEKTLFGGGGQLLPPPAPPPAPPPLATLMLNAPFRDKGGGGYLETVRWMRRDAPQPTQSFEMTL